MVLPVKQGLKPLNCCQASKSCHSVEVVLPVKQGMKLTVATEIDVINSNEKELKTILI